MTDQELIRALNRLKVETGSLACMGCGQENNCSIHGCAIIRGAADRLTSLMEDLERVTRERDAAVAQLASLDVCIYCKNGHCAARNGTKECEFEWIGKDEALGGGGDG